MSQNSVVQNSIPELLAPAGDMDALRAAVANGADAVYFGLSDFNARYRAENFTLEQLPQTMRYLHEHGVRGYVTFNTLVFSEELPQAASYLAKIAEAGVDAVIVQDLGIVRLIRHLAPGLPIHGSTQMTLTEPRGIEFVRKLGVERVIVARELSISEITAIRAGTAMPLEVFVHGALCVAYSGQCLTSEALGGRSANRGQCAQACRQPYELMVDGQSKDLGDKAYLLSPQDLAAYDLVGDLSASGVCSLKIEGRLKSAHYVAATTQTYRAALDAVAERRQFLPTPQQQLDLAQSFSRGFTHGFLSGVNHQNLVQGKFPKHRGVRVGIVESISNGGVTVRVDESLVALLASSETAIELPLKPGDGVVFDEGHPEQDEQGGRVFSVSLRSVRRRSQTWDRNQSGVATSPEHPLLEITFGCGTVNLSAVSTGATVWRTDDPALRRRLERSFSNDAVSQRVRIRVRIRGVAGERLMVMLNDPEGRSVAVYWEQLLEASRKHSLSRELVSEQFGRLGETPFVLEAVEFENADGTPADELPVMVPKSVLNALRREAIEKLTAIRSAPPLREVRVTALEDLRSALPCPSRNVSEPPQRTPALTVLVRSFDQLQAVLDWQPADGIARPAMLYCDFEDVRRYREAIPLCRDKGILVGLATPRIIKPSETGLLKQIAACQPDAVLVRNLAALSYFREVAPELCLRGDYSLNVANELTAALFLEYGLQTLVPSYDLNLEQLHGMLEKIDPRIFELVVHQHMPMFHMEHCVFSHVMSNGKDWHDCGRPCDRHQVELKDHVGEAHPLVADVGCRNTVFNAHAQSAALYLSRLREWGLQTFRVELLRETKAEVAPLLDRYARALAGRDTAPQVWRELHVLNQLGVTRGTLEFA